jgi:RNA:NAD 2'-phosphotransferase (TPT1/KptA family)
VLRYDRYLARDDSFGHSLVTVTLYHATSRQALRWIMEKGLQPRVPRCNKYAASREDEQPQGVYLWSNLEDALMWAKEMWSHGVVLRVNADDFFDRLVRDRTELGEGWICPVMIPPSCLLLVSPQRQGR